MLTYACIFSSFKWPASYLKWGTSLFICMSWHGHSCCLCGDRITLKKHKRRITSINDEEIKQLLSKKKDSNQLRVHVTCANDPHKHWKTKVSTCKKQAQHICIVNHVEWKTCGYNFMLFLACTYVGMYVCLRHRLEILISTHWPMPKHIWMQQTPIATRYKLLSVTFCHVISGKVFVCVLVCAHVCTYDVCVY